MRIIAVLVIMLALYLSCMEPKQFVMLRDGDRRTIEKYAYAPVKYVKDDVVYTIWFDNYTADQVYTNHGLPFCSNWNTRRVNGYFTERVHYWMKHDIPMKYESFKVHAERKRR